MPMKRGRRASDTALLSSPMTRPEVLVANTARGWTMPSTSAQTFFFSSMSSGTHDAAAEDACAVNLDGHGDLLLLGVRRFAQADSHSTVSNPACRMISRC